MSKSKKGSARGKIIAEFQSLLEHRSFHAVSVSDIIARADVARPTFYRNFQDKYALAEAICLEDLRAASQTASPWLAASSHLIACVEQRGVFYSRLFADREGQSIFEAAFQRHHWEFTQSPADAILAFAWYHTLSAWALGGFRTPPEAVLQKIIYYLPLGEVLDQESFLLAQQQYGANNLLRLARRKMERAPLEPLGLGHETSLEEG